MRYTATSFDTLQYAKKLQKVGFTEQQAEVQAEAIKDLIDDKLATKVDLLQLEERLTNRMNELDERLTNKMNEQEERLSHRIDEMGYKVTIRLGGMIVAGVVVLSLIGKLF